MRLSRGRQALGVWFPRGPLFAWSLALGLLFGGLASADIYEGSPFPTPLVLGGGSITFDTDNLVTVPGTVSGDLDDGVAVFRYSDVNVSSAVTVTVTGSRPLAITSSGDMIWEADIDVSGDVPGRAGGGAGGAGGAGGSSGGIGGAGGTIGAGVGIGGAATTGGRGGLRDGNASLDGEAGQDRNSGTSGQSGLAGSAGGDGVAGGNGALGNGTAGDAAGTPGTGGSAGSGGAASGSPNNAGPGAVVSGGGGNAGGSNINSTGQAGDAAGGAGVPGSPGTAGANGGDATDGQDGTGATFLTPANTLALVGGTGGGGGGGGGRGGGGQGGGSGGGGSSGGGGGGGGAMEAQNLCAGGAPVNGLGGNGRAGGAGGNGGTGGDGGTAAPGSDGGDGGSGGGAVLLATRGLLDFSGLINISAGAAGAATVGTPGVSGAAGGAAGTGGASPAAGPSNNGTLGSWAFLQSIYCTGVGTANGGNGGAGTSGGNGGAGGNGGSSGASGEGGAGGTGTPGMAKLHGSVVLALAGTVQADNAAGSAADLNGRFTFISNMGAAAVASNSPTLTNADTVTASITNDALLKAPAPYDSGLDIPRIPQLLDGPDSSGILQPTFYNDALALPLLPGVDPLEVAILPDAQTVFDGFDQLFVQNNSGSTTVGAQVVLSGYGALTLPDLEDGEIWTTLVPAGTSVGSVTPISFTTQPTPVDVYVGEPVTLTVAAIGGNGALEYQWRRNGNPLIGENGTTLSIAAADLSDNGLYDCLVTDTGSPPAPSATSATAEVGVFEHLQITQQPVGGVRFTNPPSDFAVFVGVTGGLRSVDYEWRLDGNPIIGASNSPVYYINPVTEAAGGEYSVFVSDQGTDSELSLGAVLDVNPLGFKQQPISLTVLEPDAATFSVEIEGGRTLDGLVTITYQWFKVDDSKADTPISGADTDTLVIDPTEATDAGQYYCQVTDATGPLNSNSASLTVLTTLGALSIVQQPQPLTVAEGGTAIFTVAAVGGNGPITYVWKKDGAPIVGAPNSPVLTIASVVPGDEGDYSVDVSDDDTTVASDDAALEVTEAGLPLAGPLGLAVVAGAVLAAGALRFRRRK